jgi:quercetin dioxygenase-like cupin family protein
VVLMLKVGHLKKELGCLKHKHQLQQDRDSVYTIDGSNQKSRITLLKGGAVMQQSPTRVNPSEETIQMGPTGIGIRFLLTREDTNGSVSVFEVRVTAGQKIPVPAHKNDAYEEVLYGIKGVLTWTVDGTPIEVGPGQALCIPRGAVHRFDNFSSEDVKQLAVISPAIMGPAYFREAAELLLAATGGPPDREKMVDVFRRHGMTVAGSGPAN